ncbi:MAG: MFS transporter [Acidimicrobiales bacterium]
MSQRQKSDTIAIPTLFFAIGVTTVATLPVFMTGALTVQIARSIDVTPAKLGLLVGSFFLSAVLSSVASGKFSETRGGTLLMRIGTIASSISSLLIAGFGHSYLQILAFLILGGITNGAIQPAVNVYVASAVPRSRQGFAFGVKQAAIPVATLLSGLAVPTLALTIGWRFGYVAIAIIGVVLAITLPRTKGVPRPPELPGTRMELRLGPLFTLAGGMALGAGAANALGAFLVSAAVRAGWAPGSAGLLAVVGSAAGLSARLLNGHFADRRGTRHFVVVARFVGLGSLGYLMFATGIGWLVLPATIISYGLGWGWNGLFNFAVVHTHRHAMGRATGITQSGAYLGSVLGPVVFGITASAVSFDAAWALNAVAAVGAALLILYGRSKLILAREAASPLAT